MTWQTIGDGAKSGEEVLLTDGKSRWIDKWSEKFFTRETRARMSGPHWAMAWHFPEPIFWQPLPPLPDPQRDMLMVDPRALGI